jgi:hypothetical protein
MRMRSLQNSARRNKVVIDGDANCDGGCFPAHTLGWVHIHLCCPVVFYTWLQRAEADLLKAGFSASMRGRTTCGFESFVRGAPNEAANPAGR